MTHRDTVATSQLTSRCLHRLPRASHPCYFLTVPAVEGRDDGAFVAWQRAASSSAMRGFAADANAFTGPRPPEITLGGWPPARGVDGRKAGRHGPACCCRLRLSPSAALPGRLGCIDETAEKVAERRGSAIVGCCLAVAAAAWAVHTLAECCFCMSSLCRLVSAGDVAWQDGAGGLLLLLCLGILYLSLGTGPFGGTALRMEQAPRGQTPVAVMARTEDDLRGRELPAELGRLLPSLVLQDAEPGRLICAACGRICPPYQL